MNVATHPLTRSLLRRPAVDGSLAGALAFVLALGLAVLYSATDGSEAAIVRQLVRIAVGLGAMLVFAQLPPQLLRSWTPPAFMVSVLLLVLTIVIGEGRGAQRWLDLGVVRFQPSELLKLTVPMILAWYFHGRRLPPTLGDLAVCLGLIGLPVTLIAMQPDLGTSLLIASSGAFVLFLAGIRWQVLIALASIALASSPLLWHFMHDYQKSRILTLLDPEADPLGRGWNILQSKIAVGSGGLTGKGWQAGTQSHLDFLPESSTDFILAVLAEEFGLVGVLLLLGIYLWIVGRCLTMAAAGKDTYGRLLAGSLAMTFFVYVIVNAGMISGLLPVVGVPLPMVSYGGSSIVSLLAAFGMIMSVYRHRKFLRSTRP